ncbi:MULTISPECIES: hypothetical protein [unclassified Ensifer]|uniref:hypothetical protein n=1 Tax=unclassified Ensifer TaxID=2633371 RepID=UPI000813C272|nr:MULTISPECIES: hypothetical protein [unclassified Ensifer]OCP22008.1 hypothetical protein BC361_25930 [Ensifer sp. LC54]OCP23212.1 hypothetical protein BC363_24835 [Ensifer sp. LC384]
MSDDSKKALETAIGKVARAYADLIKVAEKHGDDISKEDYEKARFFLGSTLDQIWQKVDIVRSIAKATTGEFSLDSVEVPLDLKVSWYANFPDPIRPHSTLNGRPDPAARLQPHETVIEGGAVPIGTQIVMQPRIVVPPGTPIDASQMDGKSLARAIGGRLSKAAQREAPRPEQSVNNDLGGEDGSDDDIDFIDE